MSLGKLFSKRKPKPPAQLSPEIPDQVRQRILYVFKDAAENSPGGFQGLLQDVGEMLLREYGSLAPAAYRAAVVNGAHPVLEHFRSSDTEQAIDFIEACFRQRDYGAEQAGVDRINEIFREHGVGYELTPFARHPTDKPAYIMGRPSGGTVVEIEYPRVILRSEQLIHNEVVSPTLQFLTDARLHVANSEMLKAHMALRAGNFENAITCCGSAFESFLKTICTVRPNT